MELHIPTATPDLREILTEIALERTGQIERGLTVEHDDTHSDGALATAAAHYVAAAGIAAWLGRNTFTGTPITKMPRLWPWETTWWKPGPVRRMLVKAAALIVAEIQRHDRAAARAKAALNG